MPHGRSLCGTPVCASAPFSSGPLYCRRTCRTDVPLANVLEAELEQLEQRVQRLVAAYRQARLETRRAQQERDRMVALNNELRRRIEGIVERVRLLETEQDP